MKKTKRIICLVFALLIAALCLAGCAKSKSADEAAYYTEEAAEGAYYTEDVAYDDVTEEAAIGLTDSSALGGLDEAKIVENDRKLIYTSNYSFETTSFEKDYNTIIGAINKSGGFLSEENTNGVTPEGYGDIGRTSQLTARIPVGSYDKFTSELEGVGALISKNRSTQDVTTDYYDNEARIDLYEKHYEKLNGYLENADKMEDIITIEKEMTEVLYQIDTLKGNKRYMDDKISYCTVNISLTEVVNFTAVPEKEQTFGERIAEGFTSVVAWLVEFFEGFAVILISASPILLVLFAIFAVIFFPIRASKKKRALRNKNEQK